MKKVLTIVITFTSLIACKNQTAANKEVVGTPATGTNNSSVLSDTSKITKTTVLPNGTTTTTVTTVTKPSDTLHEIHRKPSLPAKINTADSSVANSPSSSVKSSSSAASTTTSAKKKGWSDAAVGTTMGGLSGAALGAIVSKNKAEGAIIGGVAGAGAGYAIGRASDRKSGRVKKKVVSNQ